MNERSTNYARQLLECWVHSRISVIGLQSCMCNHLCAVSAAKQNITHHKCIRLAFKMAHLSHIPRLSVVSALVRFKLFLFFYLFGCLTQCQMRRASCDLYLSFSLSFSGEYRVGKMYILLKCNAQWPLRECFFLRIGH